jgi:curved DNA-binding protein CbpA
MEDLYAVLGVDPDASLEDVRVAYRALAQRFHPDHNPNDMAAERRMQEINEAFAVLNAPERRDAYDAHRAAAAPPESADAVARWAGRGARPYSGRGPNWGLKTGATEPPEFVIRAEPSGFNLVSMHPGDCPSREIHVWSDAPFPVRASVEAAPWLHVSPTHLTLVRGGHHTLDISISQEASETLHGWRDASLSLTTDDARVYCPSVRLTGVFLAPPEQHKAESLPSPEPPTAANDELRAEGERPAEGALGWLRRLFGS